MTPAEERAFVLGQQSQAAATILYAMQHASREMIDVAKGQTELIESRLVLCGMFNALGIGAEYDPELHLADLLRRLEKACIGPKAEPGQLFPREAFDGLDGLEPPEGWEPC